MLSATNIKGKTPEKQYPDHNGKNLVKCLSDKGYRHFGPSRCIKFFLIQLSKPSTALTFRRIHMRECSKDKGSSALAFRAF
jgi:hypothetical protein